MSRVVNRRLVHYKVAEALAVFETNTQAFPDSRNVWVSSEVIYRHQ